LYVGTWQDATWAIKFYEKSGFVLHKRKQTVQLLKKYWKISLKQIADSVVLEKFIIRSQAHQSAGQPSSPA
jgi:hypothetical protein